MREGFCQEFEITNVTSKELNVLSSERFPAPYAVVDRRNGCERVETKLVVKKATNKVVNNGNFIIFVGQVESGSPATIVITTNDHDFLSTRGGITCSLVRAISWLGFAFLAH